MAASLDMSLDDLIKKNKGSEGSGGSFRGGRGRGRGGAGGGAGGRGAGPGPDRRFSNRPQNRTAPYSVPPAVQVPDVLWQPPAYVGGGESSSEAGTKLYISNLDYGVSSDDIKLLFSDVGELKRYSLHYDRSGRSKGTAEVVYQHHKDALAAIKKYHDVQLDGKPMKLELVGVNIVSPVVVPPPMNGVLGHPPENFGRGQDRGARQGWNRGGGIRRGGGGRGFGRVGGRQGGRSREKVSAEDLDAELDKYHMESMQIN